MARINWDISEKIPELRLAAMDRVERAAEIIRDNAKDILRSKLSGPPISHPPYKTGKYAGKYWTEREAGAMVKTIRVVRKHESTERNVWIMAGTKKTWWALQMEFGRGGWKGGPRSFLRPAINRSIAAIKQMLLNG
jgi:hypothetical protein